MKKTVSFVELLVFASAPMEMNKIWNWASSSPLSEDQNVEVNLLSRSCLLRFDFSTKFSRVGLSVSVDRIEIIAFFFRFIEKNENSHVDSIFLKNLFNTLSEYNFDLVECVNNRHQLFSSSWSNSTDELDVHSSFVVANRKSNRFG